MPAAAGDSQNGRGSVEGSGGWSTPPKSRPRISCERLAAHARGRLTQWLYWMRRTGCTYQFVLLHSLRRLWAFIKYVALDSTFLRFSMVSEPREEPPSV